MTRKVSEYFAAGAKQVWHHFPVTKSPKVFHFPTETAV